MQKNRSFPIGAEVMKGEGVHFRLWAPDHASVTLLLGDKSYPMAPEESGYFSLLVPDAGAGDTYRFRLGDSGIVVADPASRYQPHGPFGPSSVVDSSYPWRDENWRGLPLEGQILYELHIGTFTPEGTFSAATDQLEKLVELGITTVEIMPISDFPGHYGWGYDGVNLYAPSHLYGTTEELKALIDKAHHLQLAVILDVVYNHFGPAGNPLVACARRYLTDSCTEWGSAVNCDDPGVREFILTNVRYWIEEYHFDGLRLDAIHAIHSTSHEQLVAAISRVAKEAAASRQIVVIGENDDQECRCLYPRERGGYELDALWNDDFHHSVHVRVTGARDGYYTDYLGSSRELVAAVKYGFLYQGQYYRWQNKLRGTPDLNLPAAALVIYLENHDQVAHSGRGRRLHQIASPALLRSLTALLLLAANTPLLFQGQEFGSSRPFYYFADHSDDLGELVYKGRKEFLATFPRLATPECQALIQNPGDPNTFTSCKLDWQEHDAQSPIYLIHKDLIALRRHDRVFSRVSHVKRDGAIFDDDSFLIRYCGGDSGDRLLLCNFGVDKLLDPSPEPLLAPPSGTTWQLLWSSEDIRYGGSGTPPLHTPQWLIPGHSAVVLASSAASLSHSYS